MAARRLAQSFLLVLSAAAPASAQLTARCDGQPWSELARERYGDPAVGPLIAHYNNLGGSDACPAKRYVRFPASVRHVVRLGQTLEAIAGRLYRAPGALAYLRERTGLVAPAEPDAGATLVLPVEIAVVLGARPEADLEALPKLPDRATLMRFNGLSPDERLAPGSTIYAPVELELAKALPSAESQSEREALAEEAQARQEHVAITRRPDVGYAAVEVIRSDAAARFDAFTHAAHAQVSEGEQRCAACHRDDPRIAGAFLPVSAEACTRCHASAVEPSPRTRRLPLTFSHALHTASDRQVARDGYSLDCVVCHPPSQDNLRSRAGHERCVRCHNETETPPAIGSQCEGCHGATEQDDRRFLARALLAEHLDGSPKVGAIRFDHDAHVGHVSAEDTAGDAACATCHRGVPASDDLSSVEPQRMADCMECHRGMERVLGDRVEALDRCRTCHVAAERASRPTSSGHVVRPIPHTPRFRRNHAEAARSDDGTCAACHTVLAGGRGSSCDRCHARMLPADHTPRWREEPHGRAALRRPDRCSTCHLKGRCADCHSLPPRDHFPLSTAVRDHAKWARPSVRRCQVCHQHAADCARCHGG